MSINEYRELAMRTAKALPAQQDDLNHGALGLSTEVGELCHTINCAWMRLPFDASNIPEEIGDCCWYVALLANAVNVEMEDLILDAGDTSEASDVIASAVMGRNPVALVLCLVDHIGEVNTIVKAGYIYGKPFDRELFLKHLALTFTILNLLASIHSLDFEVVLKKNIEKLKTRYPEKYKDVLAIERNDKVETN